MCAVFHLLTKNKNKNLDTYNTRYNFLTFFTLILLWVIKKSFNHFNDDDESYFINMMDQFIYTTKKEKGRIPSEGKVNSP